jgi:hypothetical protein
MFQRAVIGLSRTGLTGCEAIGEKLAIHSDLAAFILVELTNQGYMNSYCRPTEKGLQALTDEFIEDHNMVTGFIFQDPWNGEIWPRFVDRLDYCELESEENDYPKLLLGSTGKPWRQRAFMVLPNNILPVSRPTPANVITAVSSHQKGLRNTDNYLYEDDDFVEPTYSPSMVQINRVSFIEEEPTPVFLMTYVYLTDDANERYAEWYACDPFGLKDSLRLKRRIEQVMQTMPKLYDVINQMVENVVSEGLEEQRRWTTQLRTKSVLEVEKRLSVNIQSYDAFNRIVDMEFARQEATFLIGNGSSDSKLQEALRSCLKTLEAVFGTITSSNPLGEVWKRVFIISVNQKTNKEIIAPQQDREWLASTFRAAAVAIGFQEPIPESLLNTKPGHIRSVAMYHEQWRLRPLVAATILAAQLDTSHPLRRMASKEPKLLQYVDEIANQGGRAGHANNQTITLEDVERTVEITYRVISILTELGDSGNQTTVNDNEVMYVKK